jgi:aconitate hydratase
VTSLDSFKSRKTLTVGGKAYDYFSLKAAEKAGLGDLSRLPNSLKVLLENLLRYEDGRSVTKQDIQAIGAWLKKKSSDREIAYRPARVLMQDFTGVPAVVDLAAMREAMIKLGAPVFFTMKSCLSTSDDFTFPKSNAVSENSILGA